MRVQDFNGVYEINIAHEFEAALKKRYEGEANSFWLSHGSEKYPLLSILVKCDLATLHYLPKERDAGFRSVGNMPELNPGEMTVFFMDHTGQQLEVLNDAVIPFSVALAVAKEFLYSKELPQSVEWLQL